MKSKSVWARTASRTLRVLALVGLLAQMLTGLVSAASGVWPDCTWGCTANDVTISRFWLGDSAGNPLPTGCTPGEPVTAYLWATRTSTQNAQRYASALVADWSLDDVPQSQLVECLEPGVIDGAGTADVMVGQVTWICGAEMSIDSAVVAWTTDKNAVCDPAAGTCGDYIRSKCAYLGAIIVEAPLVADFSAAPVCLGATTAFSDETTGGRLPYTYAWVFGDGSTSTMANPTHTYAAAGTYTAILTVTDARVPAVVDSQTHTVTVNPNPVAAIAPTTAVLTCANPTALLTASGGGTYLWSTGATTQSITVSAAGTYTVTVTNASGCTDTATAVVTENKVPPVAGIQASATELTCDITTATLTASATGGTAPYAYSWSTGATTQAIDVTAPGTYTVTVTGANGCTDTDQIVITQNVSKPVAAINATATELTCDVTTSTLTAQVTGGTAPYAYSWSTGATTQAIDVTAPGTYTVTVTGANGCTDTEQIVITQNVSKPVAAINATATELTCGVTTSTLTASATGGTAPYSYAWSTGGTTQSIDVSAPGTYTVTVTGANGCTDTEQIVITQDISAPSVTVGATATELTCDVTTSTLAAQVTGGTAPYSYSWSTGATTQSIGVTAPGTYTVTVTGANGCTDSEQIVITQNISAPSVTVGATATELTCDVTTSTLAAQVTGGTAPYAYSWSTGATTQSIDVAAPGAYSVTVTGANGCVDTDEIAITQDINAPSVTIGATATELTCEVTTSTLTAQVTGGTAPYAYAWSTGATTQAIDVTAPGTYTVTVTGANGCEDTDQIVITQDLSAPSVVIAADYTELTCDVTTATLTAQVTGGIAPLSYLWSTGATTQAIDVTAPGAYSVTVTGANGCTDTDGIAITQDISVPSVTIPEPAQLTCDLTSVTLTAQTGLVAAADAGPLEYLWSTGATTQSIDVTAPGLYSVTVTSPNGCSDSAQVTVSQDIAAPSVNIDAPVVELTCEVTTATLTAVLEPETGTGPFSYAWSTGATTQSIDVTAPGTYSVTVTGANGCSDDASVTITQSTDKPELTIVAPVTHLTCDVQSATLSASVTAGTGVGPFTYAWSTGATTQVISVSAPGSYSVTVTGANGCSSTANVVITQDITPPAVQIAAPAPLSAAVTSVLLDASVTAGTAPFAYSWSTGATTQDINVTTPGTYVLTVKGANGCSAQASATVAYQNLQIVKVGQTTPAEMGDTLSYTITVTNLGTVTLTNVIVSDPLLGLNLNIGSLAAGASQVVTGTHVVGEADIPADFGPGDTSFIIPNTATATSDQVGPVSDSWSVTVNYEFYIPRVGLSIDKMGPTTANVGDTIVYTIVVRNTGEADLTNVSVVDAKLGMNEVIPLLAAGASQTFTRSYGPVTEGDLPGPVHNTATASSAQTGSVEDSWDVPVSQQVEPCVRTDVAVIVYGGWNGISVKAWAAGAEQTMQYTALNAFGQPQATWAFWPGDGESWTVTVQPQLPAELDPARWELKALSSPTVTFSRCQSRTVYYQLIDNGPKPTPVPTVPVLPQAGHSDSGGELGGVLVRLGIVGMALAGGWLITRKMSAARSER